MKISRNWLSDYVDFDDLSAEQFAELITTRVAEVDKVFTAAPVLAHALVARIKSVEPHPSKPHLRVAVVNIGTGEVRVVCGAPNCAPGMVTAFIAPGQSIFLPGAAAGEGEKLVQVEHREVSGIESAGTLVSEAELGLTGEHTGIIEITPELLDKALRSGRSPKAMLEPGTPLAACLGGPDLVLEVDNKSLTHRPDLWSHFGFAREIAAILKRPLKSNADLWADDQEEGTQALSRLGGGETNFSIEIAAGCGCRRFAAVEIRNAAPAPSPLWMRRRLFAVGAGVRNLLVDLSNYVMHDLGQPNHTYDADNLAGNVVYVRGAREGEKFLGLDGEIRDLTPEDIVIADASGPVALGGVMGGGPSAVTDATTRLLLESANFDPVRIRRTTKRQALRTDASNRFEKSASPYAVPLALQRYTGLLSELLGQVEIVSGVADAFPDKPKPLFVPFTYDYIRTRLGTENSDNEIRGILTGLGFKEARDAEGRHAVQVPYYRATRDISIPDDLVEEVGRTYGYEHVPEAAPKIQSVAALPRPLAELESRIQDLLSGIGFSEAYNYSFMNEERAKQLGYGTDQAVRLQNPIDAQKPIIRTTLVPGMLELVEENKRHTEAVLLYEIGRAYETSPSSRHAGLKLRAKVNNPAAYERRLVSIAYSAGGNETQWGAVSAPPIAQGAEFFALRTVLARVCRLVSGKDLELAPLTPEKSQSAEASDYSAYKNWMHPFRAASVSLAGTPLGVIAEVHPCAFQNFCGRAVVAEMDIELLLEADAQAVKFKALPKYPDSFFEMSVVMPKRSHYRELEQLVLANIDRSVMRGMEVIAVYEGAPLKPDEKSISVRLSLGADDRTLSGEELAAIQQRLVRGVETSRFALRS